MRYKAAFFDRDGTLTYFDPEKKRWRDTTVASWSGRELSLPYERIMRLFSAAAGGSKDYYRDLDEERAFYRRYYRLLLEEEGVRENLDGRAELLFSELWCNHERIVYPEVIETLEYFRAAGYKMGVISDTSPSLELTLEQAGIAHYFDSFTASSLVGAMKPSPIIFNAALASLGVTAEESLYVDDYYVEADGAREQGFTSFLIDRNGERPGKWSISSLLEMADFAKRG